MKRSAFTSFNRLFVLIGSLVRCRKEWELQSQQEVNQAHNERDSVRKEAQELTVKLDEYTVERHKLQNNLVDSEHEMRKKEVELATLRSDMMKEFASERSAYELRINKMKEQQIMKLENAITAKDSKLGHLEKQLTSMKATLTSKDSDLDIADAAKACMANKLNELEKKYLEATGTNLILEPGSGHDRHAESELRRLRMSLQQLQDQNRDSLSTIALLRDELKTPRISSGSGRTSSTKAHNHRKIGRTPQFPRLTKSSESNAEDDLNIYDFVHESPPDIRPVSTREKISQPVLPAASHGQSQESKMPGMGLDHDKTYDKPRKAANVTEIVSETQIQTQLNSQICQKNGSSRTDQLKDEGRVRSRSSTRSSSGKKQRTG